MSQKQSRPTEAEHRHTHFDISDHALQIATYIVLIMFVAMIAIAVFGLYLHH